MKLLIIGYCHLDDGFLYGAKALERLNYKIFFFPYLNYVMDNIENRDDILIEYIKNNHIDICLWWNNRIKYETIKKTISLTGKKCHKNYLFNWDPFLYNYNQYDSPFWQELINQKKIIYPLMNHVFSCFETEIKYFHDILPISYNPPGFDKEISKYIYDEEYKCDISIVCTNLYDNVSEFPNKATNITRYEIVNTIYKRCKEDNILFHLYGPEKFKDLYPESYRGYIKYQDCNKVFSNSKINLSIHPIVKELNSENSKQEYFSERVPQILGCRGLLVTNSYFTDILKENEDYIYIDNKIDWYSTLLNIIRNRDDYDTIAMNGHKKALSYYQWDNWAKRISFLENIE
jgi:hypothetical protein